MQQELNDEKKSKKKSQSMAKALEKDIAFLNDEKEELQ
jgi:hypothetical protein